MGDVMGALDAIFRAGTDVLFTYDSSPGTLRAPYRIRRADGSEAIPRVAAVALAGASSLVLEEAGNVRVSGTIPQGATVIHSGTTYTVQADAAYSKRRVTLSLSPVLAGAARRGDPVTLSSAAVHGDATDAAGQGYRYRLTTVTLAESRPGLDVGTRMVEIEVPAGALTPQRGWAVYDSAGAKVCTIGRILDQQPESVLAEAA